MVQGPGDGDALVGYAALLLEHPRLLDGAAGDALRARMLWLLAPPERPTAGALPPLQARGALAAAADYLLRRHA